MKRKQINCPMFFDYESARVQGNPQELILLLHGFSETGSKILSRLTPSLPDHSMVLAPNGPFPIPHKTESGYKIGYSWYFYDPNTRDYFIDMSVAVEFIFQGIQSLGLEKVPKKIVGFSQGGYLAPFVAFRFGNVSQIIGIGCEYLTDEFPKEISCENLSRLRIDGIHGELDDVVSVKDAIQTHASLQTRSFPGQLTVLPGIGHRITPEVQTQVAKSLAKSLLV